MGKNSNQINKSIVVSAVSLVPVLDNYYISQKTLVAYEDLNKLPVMV